MSGGTYYIERDGKRIAESANQADIIHLWEAGVARLCWTPTHRPIKKWSEAAKASARAKRHRRRIEQKFPLLAPVLLAPNEP